MEIPVRAKFLEVFVCPVQANIRQKWCAPSGVSGFHRDSSGSSFAMTLSNISTNDHSGGVSKDPIQISW